MKSALVFMTGTLVPNVTIKARPERVVILDRMDVPMVFKRSTERSPTIRLRPFTRLRAEPPSGKPLLEAPG